jgi:hypothetical protein
MAEVTYFVALPFVATDDLLLLVDDPYAPILQNCFSATAFSLSRRRRNCAPCRPAPR